MTQKITLERHTCSTCVYHYSIFHKNQMTSYCCRLSGKKAPSLRIACQYYQGPQK